MSFLQKNVFKMYAVFKLFNEKEVQVVSKKQKVWSKYIYSLEVRNFSWDLAPI